MFTIVPVVTGSPFSFLFVLFKNLHLLVDENNYVGFDSLILHTFCQRVIL